MPQKITFNNRTIVEPGAYARIVGGEPQAPESASFGKVLIIDTGFGAGRLGGSGVNGTHFQGPKSVYEFEELPDFRRWIRGGLPWDVANYLFNPSPSARGCESLLYVSAKTTTPASETLTFGGGTAATLGAPTIALGVITVIPVSTGGSGYVSAPTVNIVGDGTGAVATATIALGAVTGIVISNGGTGYTTATITLSGGVNVNGGTMTIQTMAEGTGANGVEDANDILRSGFAITVAAGVNDPAKLFLQFWGGTFKGLDTSSEPFDFIAEVDSPPELIISSPEFDSHADLVAWMTTDYPFSTMFKLTASAATGTGALVSGVDTIALAGNNLFAGATETYNAADLDAVFDSIQELNYSFILLDKYGVTDGRGSVATQIFSHIVNDADFDITMVVGGGQDRTQYAQSSNSSFDIANYFNSSKVRTVHGDVLKTRDTGGFKRYSSLHHAASYCGRIAGLEPQQPATWKDLCWDGVVHELLKKEREAGLLVGVNHLRVVGGRLVINQEVTSMRKNNQMVYPTGDSPEGSVMRISAIINKELKLNGQDIFVGGNVNTASPADVKTFVEGYLSTKTATKTVDNLIISFRDVKVRVVGADVFITYGFVPNGPVNRLFFTGTMFNVNLSA